MFEDQVIVGEPTVSAKAKISLAILNNEIVQAEYKIQRILTIVLEGDAKVENNNEWRTYCERNPQLEKQRRQEFSMIRYQCIQVLLYNMKHDAYWDNTSES